MIIGAEGRNSRERLEMEYFVYTIKTKDADIPRETLTHLRVDSSVKEIPEEVFTDCVLLKNVQLPDTITRIRRGAFTRCSKLLLVEFVSDAASLVHYRRNRISVFPGRSLLQIDQEAFLGCKSLHKVIVCSTSTRLGDGVFFHCQFLTTAQLPEGLQVIPPHLFDHCHFLRTVNIPSSVIKICKNAFNECSRLTYINLPYGLLEIGEESFQGCGLIGPLQIPSTVSSIGEYAFGFCYELKQVKLPPTLKRIERFTFICTSLEYIEIPSTVCFIGYGAFSDCDFLSNIRIPPGVENIAIHTFINCNSLISLELPEVLLIGIIDNGTEDNGIFSLVNLAIPTLPEDDDYTSDWLYENFSKLGSVVDDEADVSRKLKHRFDSSQLNKLCYYQSYLSSEDAVVQLHSQMEDDPLAATNETDEFGMTPLHILSLSQTPNMDMLLTVMNRGYLDHIIQSKDTFGSSSMDYLCLNRMPDSAEVIRRVLETRFGYLLGLDRSWKSDVLLEVEKVLAVEWSTTRRSEMIDIYLKLARYERKEIFSILELCLWKTRIDEFSSKKEQIGCRESCRINSGASVVIPHVLPFLDKLGVEDYSIHPT
eukprot:scaffold2747_cov104-Cylindrotheca_fusiformis.AAC.2